MHIGSEMNLPPQVSHGSLIETMVFSPFGGCGRPLGVALSPARLEACRRGELISTL